MTSTETTTHASLPRRLMAMLYDGFLLLAMLFCSTMLYTVIVVALSGELSQTAEVQTGDTLTQLEPVALGWPIYPLLTCIYFGFFIYFWRINGQTLGMQVWKIKLISESGQAITVRQTLLRLVAACASAGLLGLGYLSLLRGSDGRTWQGRFSKTRVVHIDPHRGGND